MSCVFKMINLCNLAFASSFFFQSGISNDCETKRQNIELEVLEAALGVSSIQIISILFIKIKY